MTRPDTVLADRWVGAFFERLREPEFASPLRQAAVGGSLGEWTRLMTDVVVASCAALGWPAAAKGHPLDLLPKAGQEYLGLDVVAFAPPAEGGPAWPFPRAVFELENQRDRAAYSLWKVICVRAELRVLFAYRNDWRQVGELVRSLRDEVISGYTIEQRQKLDPRTLLITGSRGESETFPYGFFRLWRLNPNTGEFERGSF